ncbi:hypothetical protein FE391_24305 [Nonomuraea sp. KC401]|uniref:hypothetical protein n=1 Tax=unclassified Nonomuraea TaxID=2593643 RepID=UPI0010FD3058|nr:MULTISPECIES: hypothetical protein [unclassified Nonomuraea]NBE98597.1 hypothetical protein [Nonomuraea sp. K271]TLF66419.1 hypothetical protein FE391_24305 [Nonomuraea sp. KC401]
MLRRGVVRHSWSGLSGQRHLALARAVTYQALGDAATGASSARRKALAVAEEMIALARQCHDDALADYRDTVTLAARQAAGLPAHLAIPATRVG